MGDDKHHDDDVDLEKLVEQAEAGVADVIEAYEHAERHYVAALATTPQATTRVVYGANTSST